MGVNGYLFVNGVQIYKAKDSEINTAPFGLVNVSKDLSVDNVKKTGLHECLWFFSWLW